MIYRGPGVVREIVAGLRERLSQHGFQRLEQAVGTGHQSERAD
jgi:dihydroorotate dehydrogenase